MGVVEEAGQGNDSLLIFDSSLKSIVYFVEWGAPLVEFRFLKKGVYGSSWSCI